MRSRAGMLLLLTTSAIFGQSSAGTLRFDVASVRPGNPDNPPHGTPLVINHGTVTLNDASLRQLIGHAYNVQRVRVVDCPSWCDSEGFDVAAKAENPDATQDQIRQMLQTLLAGRFGLATHREKRKMQMYTLALDKNGPKLHDATADEKGGLDDRPGHLVFKKTPMRSLAALLANILDTPVEDMTGLKGLYDFTLEAADGAAAGGAGDPRDVLRNAVENIGLKLESGKRPVEAVVVEHAERPSPN